MKESHMCDGNSFMYAALYEQRCTNGNSFSNHLKYHGFIVLACFIRDPVWLQTLKENSDFVQCSLVSGTSTVWDMTWEVGTQSIPLHDDAVPRPLPCFLLALASATVIDVAINKIDVSILCVSFLRSRLSSSPAESCKNHLDGWVCLRSLSPGGMGDKRHLAPEPQPVRNRTLWLQQ